VHDGRGLPMGDLVVLQRRQRILAVVAAVALVAAFALLFRTASERSTESIDPAVEDEATPAPDASPSLQGAALRALTESAGDPVERSAVEVR